MRILLVLRGVPGSGKSTWVRNHDLEPFTLSSDTIRLQLVSPMLSEDRDNMTIPQASNKQAKEILEQMVDSRMSQGALTVIDRTSVRMKDLEYWYYKARKYNYRIEVLNFDISLEDALRQNRERSPYKIVPEIYVRNFHTNKIKDDGRVNADDRWTSNNNLDEYWDLFSDNYAEDHNLDLQDHEKMHVIGDIQGCFEPLKEYMNKHYNPKDHYIFVGDLTDRGIQNGLVVKWAMQFKKDNPDNSTFLWGNHEQWLWNWAANIQGAFLPRDFTEKTMPQLETSKIDKKELVKFLKQTRDMYLYGFEGWETPNIIVTHAGITNVICRVNFIEVPSINYIKGVGAYKTDIDKIFSEGADPTSTSNDYQIHGHRNAHNLPIETSEYSFNLEGKVEFGGHLRIVQHTKEGFEFFEIKNDVYDEDGITTREQSMREKRV